MKSPMTTTRLSLSSTRDPVLSPDDNRATLFVLFTMLALAAFIYAPTVRYDFIANYDDFFYILNNAALEQGLSAAGIAWAFSTTYLANWHPLTWLSYLLDYELHGLKSGGYHLTNVLMHAVSGLVLFAALRALTGSHWRNAFVCALFVVHPLHVESVAWISERKDVLCGLFWFLTLWAYARYAKKKDGGRYALVLAAAAGALMSKAMAVTLPCTLLLLDAWPLRRIALEGPYNRLWFRQAGWLIAEKLPLFGGAVAVAIVTMAAQGAEGAVQTLESFTPGTRVVNAVAAYGGYLEKTVWPAGLAVFYPVPDAFPAVRFALGMAALVGGAGLSVSQFRRRPYILIGWLWFVGTLAPVIGLIQVGSQAMADRYAYIPHVGLFLAVVWGAVDWAVASLRRRTAVGWAGVAVVAALTIVAMQQVTYWRDGLTLFSRALAVTEQNFVAEHAVGFALEQRGDTEAARSHYARAIRYHPGFVDAYVSLADLLADEGRYESAVNALNAANAERPGHPAIAGALAATYLAWGSAAVADQEIRTAAERFAQAVEHDPENADARANYGTALAILGQTREAIEQFEAALALDPGNETARRNLARAREELRERAEN